ncbi:branched-chain amino acid ABC transporter substrate-binding protein, partial [Eubacteriales bacterium DFI.9.88]|nr:branched-chain amino acid ABC transporter substrate-binding protein [Eubacteriales bacterium DFI.9.88]
MSKAKKIMAGILAAGVFSLSLAGCTTFNNFKEAFINKNASSDDTIRIGVYEPMSGADKEQGELEVRRIELAHDLYPNVLGKQVELV